MIAPMAITRRYKIRLASKQASTDWYLQQEAAVCHRGQRRHGGDHCRTELRPLAVQAKQRQHTCHAYTECGKSSCKAVSLQNSFREGCICQAGSASRSFCLPFNDDLLVRLQAASPAERPMSMVCRVLPASSLLRSGKLAQGPVCFHRCCRPSVK